MNNNENIDLMIANYLSILGNSDLYRKLDNQTIHNMQSAVAIYASTTSVKYVDSFRKQQSAASQQEEINKMYK